MSTLADFDFLPFVAKKWLWLMLLSIALITSSWNRLRIITIITESPKQSMREVQQIRSSQSLILRGNKSENFPESEDMPPAFTIRSNRTFAFYKGGSELETFHSFVPTGDGYQSVFNHKQLSSDKKRRRGSDVYLETIQLSPSFERNETSRRRLGEGFNDPRAFLWNESAYCLTWKIDWSNENKGKKRKNADDSGGGPDKFDALDFETFIINLYTGEQLSINHCVGGYRGKNWIPLVHRGRLYVVHRFSPKMKWFVYDAHEGCTAPTSAETGDIDEWRGGSAFVPFGSHSAISLGHRTLDGNTHIPFLIHVDMSTNRSSMIKLSTNETAWEGILDPTSLWWGHEERLFMGTVRTAGRWRKRYFNNCNDCGFNNSIYEVQLKQSSPSHIL